MKWGRIWSRGCRVIYTDPAGHLTNPHRHTIKGYRPSTDPNLWAYRIICTNDPSRYRPTKNTTGR
jgi:hypothetical protein